MELWWGNQEILESFLLKLLTTFVFLPAILTEIKPNYYSQVYQGECHVSGLSIQYPALP